METKEYLDMHGLTTLVSCMKNYINDNSISESSFEEKLNSKTIEIGSSSASESNDGTLYGLLKTKGFES